MGISSLQDIKSKKLYLAFLAEVLGTALLVLIACGSTTNWAEFIDDPSAPASATITTATPPAVVAAPAPPPAQSIQNNMTGKKLSGNTATTTQISLCFGFSVATIVWIIARVSGGHINPAVTIGFLVTRKITVVRSILYVVGQCLGAVVGAAVLSLLIPRHRIDTLGTSAPHGEVNGLSTCIIEGVLAFVLVLAVFATCDSRRKDLQGSGPLAIGVAIAMCHLWAVPVTGSGMNPARVFGPAIVSGNMEHHWAYWLGPLIGGAHAALFYDLLLAANATTAKVAGFFKRNYDDGDYDERGLMPERAAANKEAKYDEVESEELKPRA